jgi:hypothetical protein
MKKSLLNSAIGAAIGISSVAITPVASADVLSLDWNGLFTMQDSTGALILNSSTAAPTVKNPSNQYQTAVTGTMQFDTVSGAGTATLVPFDFFGGSLPAEAVGINMQAIGNGMGGAGSLVLGNMLFNWNGSNGIPVSIVLDASGFFASQDPGAVGAYGDGWADGTLDTTDNLIQNTGATPASDGIYVGINPNVQGPALGNGPGGYAGYLATGPVPIATTAWNTTLGAGCAIGNCAGVSPSGVLPLVADTVDYANDYSPNTGADTGVTGVGGNPMASGPFQGSNANFDVTSLTITGVQTSATPILAPNCNFDPSGNLCAPPPTVPVPAAVWLFGSGLLGLVGVARRKKSEV